MKTYITLDSGDINRSLDFYVDKLSLFVLDKKITETSVLIKPVQSESVYIWIDKGTGGKRNMFQLVVDDCENEFNRLSGLEFEEPSGIVSMKGPYGDRELIEYPLGKVFYIRDPDENTFGIFEERLL